jgi:hypothetical protein
VHAVQAARAAAIGIAVLQYAPVNGRTHVTNGARRAVRRIGQWYLLVFSAWVCLSFVGPLAAASFTLAPRERDEAIRLGRRSIVSDEFGGEWKVAGEGAGQSLMVMTPFHRLALAARNSAFKSQELKAKEIETAIGDQPGSLVLWATLKGKTADFARFYSPVLLNDHRASIKASFSQNERTARREDDGSYSARCLYVFPVAALRADETVTLLVKDMDEKQVAKFTVDLSSMR